MKHREKLHSMEDFHSESDLSDAGDIMEPETVTEDARFSRQTDLAGEAAGAWADFAAQHGPASKADPATGQPAAHDTLVRRCSAAPCDHTTADPPVARSAVASWRHRRL